MRLLRWAPLPALALFLLVRLIDLGLFWHFGQHQAPLAGPGSPLFVPQRAGDGLDGILSSWDGQWYQRIASEGYPHSLPSFDGYVVQNAWAFFPLFPLLAGGLMEVTGAPFVVAGSVVDLACSLVAVVVLHRMVARHSSPAVATWTVVGLAIAPASAVFLMTYTEGPALLVALLALEGLQQRRYGVAGAWTLLMGLTRPIAPAIGLAALIALLLARRRRAVGGRELRGTALVVVASLVAFAVWPITAAVVTGRADAYTTTQSHWLGPAGEGLVERSWAFAALALDRPERTVMVLVAAVLLLVLTLRGAAAGAWPVELRGWALAYALFVTVTTRPGPSIVRYLLLVVVPWWPAPGVAERPVGLQRIVAAGAIAVGVILHVWWISVCVRTAITGPSPYYP